VPDIKYFADRKEAVDALTLKDQDEYDKLKELLGNLDNRYPDHSVPTVATLYGLQQSFRNVCPSCLTSKFAKLENHDPMWGDGDVVCQFCGTKIRNWDSG